MIISRELWKTILLHLERELPREGVGVLVLPVGDDGFLNLRYIPLRNTAKDEAHFRVDPAEWVSLLFELERSGERLLAIVHSHPASPPVPSQEDMIHFHYSDVFMLIVSLQDKMNPAAHLYKQKEQRLQRHPFVIRR